MMTSTKKITILILSLLVSGNALAQDSLFFKQERNGVKGVLRNPQYKPGNLDPLAKNNNNVESYKITGDPNLNCEGGRCAGDDVSELEKKLVRMQAGEKRHEMNVYAPMAGFADTMFSQVHADSLSTILSSPTVLYNTTMLLTEPAVAGGVQNSVMQGLGSVQNRYLAEDNFIKQLEANPETKEVALRAYKACVSRIIKEEAEEEGVADRATWIQAQSICMADRIQSLKDAGPARGGGQNFDSLNGDGFGTGTGFTARFDNDHKEVVFGQNDEPNAIRLTDYIFNRASQEPDPNNSSGNNVAPLTNEDIKSIKADFKSLFGDYVFKFDSNTMPSGILVSATRQLTYKREKPTKEFNDLYKERQEKVYTAIMQLVYEKCQFTPSKTATPNSPSTIFCGEGGERGNRAEDFLEMSVNGFLFQCNDLDLLYANFKNDYPAINSEEQNVRLQQCTDFDPNGAAKLEDVVGDKSRVTPALQAVYTLASKVAQAQLYGIVIQANDLVQRMAAQNGVNNFILSFADQLIYSVIGQVDLLPDYNKILQNINDNKAEMVTGQANRPKPTEHLGSAINETTDATSVAAGGT